MQSAIEQISSSLALYSSDSRLYALVVQDGPDLLVEAFTADDELQGTGPRDVIVLSTDARLVELVRNAGASKPNQSAATETR